MVCAEEQDEEEDYEEGEELDGQCKFQYQKLGGLGHCISSPYSSQYPRLSQEAKAYYEGSLQVDSLETVLYIREGLYTKQILFVHMYKGSMHNGLCADDAISHQWRVIWRGHLAKV